MMIRFDRPKRNHVRFIFSILGGAAVLSCLASGAGPTRAAEAV